MLLFSLLCILSGNEDKHCCLSSMMDGTSTEAAPIVAVLLIFGWHRRSLLSTTLSTALTVEELELFLLRVLVQSIMMISSIVPFVKFCGKLRGFVLFCFVFMR